MKGLWKNISDFWGKDKPLSIRIPLVLLLFAVGMIPIGIYSRIVLTSVEKSQVSSRQVDVQNQCLILSSKMTRAGYIYDAVRDASINTEMNVTADLFHGRILVVDQNYRIIKDTFDLVEGKIVVSEEVIRCFQGENSNVNNSDKNYFVQTIPIYENTPDKAIQGVLVAAASTEYVSRQTAASKSESQFFLMIMAIVLLLVSTSAAELLIRPLLGLEQMLTRAADGNLTSDIHEHTYRETKEISETVSSMFSKLKEVDQSRQEFVSNVSHELKTPITSIRVLADSLMGMEGASVELYQEFMRDISDEIDRESKIIDDLLSLVKMDKAGEAQMKVSPISINQLMEMILKRLRPIAGKRNVELIYESIREVSADVDEVKLSLAFNNLVENAIKYNVDNGWVKVTLDADHKAFYVTVADSGIGIPEEFQRYIFDRFYRVDKARSRETGGTGLGLAITKSVIFMHNGTIKVESREGEGTVFTVRIPLNYVPSGAGKNGGNAAGAVKNSPALKSFWIANPKRKKKQDSTSGQPAERTKEREAGDGQKR